MFYYTYIGKFEIANPRWTIVMVNAQTIPVQEEVFGQQWQHIGCWSVDDDGNTDTNNPG